MTRLNTAAVLLVLASIQVVDLDGTDGGALAASYSRLGDLSKFQRIAHDTAALVNKGDLAGARTRIRDLETSWGQAVAILKPRALASWYVVDMAVDEALAVFRTDRPDTLQCKRAMAYLLEAMDRNDQ